MDERNIESEKMDEVMLPGFRFHPTDEELVGFYLRRKIQQRPLSIELIKQLDIYKFDPWDLPKMAATGEKEWYFYCPRDRKYRNSARPNRVTGAGFWKATGTDRPIYSSEGGSKCIGLKKSLVFYKGRAAKGIKTEWMMHEFRLPSISDTGPSKRYIDKDNIPANDAWAICRIFKKANSSAQRALSQSWVSSLPETSVITAATTATTSDLETHQHVYGSTSIFSSSKDLSLNTKNSIVSSVIQFWDSSTNTASDAQQSSMASFSPFYFSPYTSIISNEPSVQLPISKCDEIPINSTFPTNIPTSQEPSSTCTAIDASSLLQNMPSSIFGDFDDKLSGDQYFHNFSAATLTADQGLMRRKILNQAEQEETGRTLVNDPNAATILRDQQQWETMQSVGYPFNLPFNNSMADAAWKCNFFWDSSPCPSSDLSTSFSTNKCYS